MEWLDKKMEKWMRNELHRKKETEVAQSFPKRAQLVLCTVFPYDRACDHLNYFRWGTI